MATTRREFVLGGVALSAAPSLLLGSRAIAATSNRVVRIGMLTSGAPVRWEMIETATAAGLREKGYKEGENLSLIRRAATYPDKRMDAHARELVASKVDVIVTSCGWSTKVATESTRTIPIVMGSVTNAVERGFVKSLARSGNNVTGSTGHVPKLGPKMLEFMRIAQPSATLIGVLSNPQNPLHSAGFRDVETAARDFNFNVVDIDLHRLASREPTANVLKGLGVHALMVQPDDDLYFEFLEHIFGVAETMRVATFFTKRDLVDMGGLFSYGANSVDIFKRCAVYVDRILKGTNPTDLPIEHPTKLEFAINLKKAQALGIEVPRAALLRADYLVR